MKQHLKSGFSMVAVLLLASVIGLAAMSLPSILKLRDNLKEKSDRASYKQTVQMLLRRKMAQSSAWDTTACDNQTQSCPPTGVFPRTEIFTIPNCTPDPNQNAKCNFNIQITNDTNIKQLIYSLQEGGRSDFIEWFRIPHMAILSCNGEDGRFIFNHDKRSAGVEKGTNCQKIGDHNAVPSEAADEIMGRCPAGQYMTGIDVANKRLNCESLPSAVKSCPSGQYIKEFEWTYEENGSLTFDVVCTNKKVTI